MASHYEIAQKELQNKPQKWLVTGVSGFIGSHLLETLLLLEQEVVGLDNFSTGRKENLEDVRARAGDYWKNFQFIEGDIRELEACRRACDGVSLVLHQAALGSVPKSIEDPLRWNASNVSGTLNLFVAARDAGVSRVVYASSSSVYGDSPALPKVEDVLGRPLSPYAASKRADELYAEAFFAAYGLELIGLRYFNVFGPRQNPEGAYAAVIPRWIESLRLGEECVVHGDGETSRDFCFVKNVVQANILSAVTQNKDALGLAYNVAVGEQTSLLELYSQIRTALAPRVSNTLPEVPVRGPFRAGDVRHSLADISRAKNLLGYEPTHTLLEGLAQTVEAYVV